MDWLIRTQPETTFAVVSLWPVPGVTPARYARPKNVVTFKPLYLQNYGERQVRGGRRHNSLDRLASTLNHFMQCGGGDALAQVMDEIGALSRSLPLSRLFNGKDAWDLIGRMYQVQMPYGSFLHYFWACRALLGGLFACLEFRLPPARIYHTISTGYAGVLAARAGIETGRPVLLTEHGIYTNERRIELLQASWLADMIDKGHAIDDPRLDLRDIWIQAFEAYARACYETASEVITLYEDNQRVQQVLGADRGRCRVIANGIDIARFRGLVRGGEDQPPTIALIGRVVPIKDVKGFISTVAILRRRLPGLKALVMGPVDEDPEYVAACRDLVDDLSLGGTVEFTGAVDILKFLPQIHVVMLTSLSESQPLTLLEAGAAGIPFVATNVGSCREIIEGRSDEQPPLGHGGIVTPVVDAQALADAAYALLIDPQRRRTCGEALRRRVETYYTSEQAAGAYQALYARHLATDAANGGRS
jgi:glycosyltransferase involved in cell wall biosynthesis